MQEILRQVSRLILMGAFAVSTALAQSPPPTQDPAKIQPPSERTQKSQDQPVQQQDTVSPKNSKEDVDAIGNRNVPARRVEVEKVKGIGILARYDEYPVSAHAGDLSEMFAAFVVG